MSLLVFGQEDTVEEKRLNVFAATTLSLAMQVDWQANGHERGAEIVLGVVGADDPLAAKLKSLEKNRFLRLKVVMLEEEKELIMPDILFITEAAPRASSIRLASLLSGEGVVCISGVKEKNFSGLGSHYNLIQRGTQTRIQADWDGLSQDKIQMRPRFYESHEGIFVR